MEERGFYRFYMFNKAHFGFDRLEDLISPRHQLQIGMSSEFREEYI
jgi:hypothetical protein